jgi:hypothetical protein
MNTSHYKPQVFEKLPLPMIVGSIFITKDLSQIRERFDNRDKSDPEYERRVKKIQNSLIKRNRLYLPIEVDPTGLINDGHTRLDAMKRLNMTPIFQVGETMTDEEFNERNDFKTELSNNDKSHQWAQRGRQEFVVYREFKKKYGFSDLDTIAILGNKPTVASYVEVRKVMSSGVLEIVNQSLAEEKAEKIIAVKKIAPHVNPRAKAFFRVLNLALTHPKSTFDYNWFIYKVKNQPHLLVNVNKDADQKKIIEFLYNYAAKKEENKFYFTSLK